MPDSNAPARWQPDRAPVPRAVVPLPPLPTAITRGFMNRCPSCGIGHVFAGYLLVVGECSNCAAPLSAARADDAPPYFTLLVVGHMVVPLMFWFDHSRNPPLWLLAAIFLPLTTALCIGLLRPIKGATVGLMLKVGLMKADDD